MAAVRHQRGHHQEFVDVAQADQLRGEPEDVALSFNDDVRDLFIVIGFPRVSLSIFPNLCKLPILPNE